MNHSFPFDLESFEGYARHFDSMHRILDDLKDCDDLYMQQTGTYKIVFIGCRHVLKLGPKHKDAYNYDMFEGENHVMQEYSELFVPMIDAGAVKVGDDQDNYDYRSRQVYYQIQERWRPLNHLTENKQQELLKDHFAIDLGEYTNSQEAIEEDESIDPLKEYRNLQEKINRKYFSVKEAFSLRNLGYDKGRDEIRPFDC